MGIRKQGDTQRGAGAGSGNFVAGLGHPMGQHPTGAEVNAREQQGDEGADGGISGSSAQNPGRQLDQQPDNLQIQHAHQGVDISHGPKQPKGQARRGDQPQRQPGQALFAGRKKRGKQRRQRQQHPQSDCPGKGVKKDLHW